MASAAAAAHHLQVDVDDNDDTACGISGVPTFQFYKDGVKVDELQHEDADEATLEARVAAAADADAAEGNDAPSTGRSAAPPTTVAIGTTNAGKCQAVRAALASYERLAGCALAPTKVESGVADQPMTLAETLQGAKNRARGALEAFWEGGEGGGGGGGRGGGRGGRDAEEKGDGGGNGGSAAGAAAAWGIGMESGLFEDPDGALFDLTACCIFDGQEE
jgi:hypothetical protein